MILRILRILHIMIKVMQHGNIARIILRRSIGHGIKNIAHDGERR